MKKFMFTIIVCLLLPTGAFGVPESLTHQGRIIDTNGAPVTGSANLTFNLYADPEGGSSVWTQTIATTMDNGYFSVTLGPGTPELSTTIFDGSDFYMGITLEGIAEFAPRHKINAVPYAIRSGSVTGEVNATGGLTVDGTEVVDSNGNLAVSGNLTGDTLTLPQGPLGDLPSASDDNKGQVYFATDTGAIYYSDGNEWSEIGSSTGGPVNAPQIGSISPAQIEPDTAETITINGQNFEDGCEVHFGPIASDTVQFISPNEVQASSMALESGLHTVRVTNPVGLRGQSIDALSVDASPTWVTSSGSLGTLMDSGLGDHYTLEVNDPEGQITFSLVSGALPPGISLDSETGVISGDAEDVSEDTLYSFAIQATDGAREPHVIEETFSITVTHRLPITLAMWSGYCSQTSSGKYCTDVTEWDTTDGKISVASDGTITTNTAGYYRINAWAIGNVSGWNRSYLYVNGTYRYYGHDYNDGDWSDNRLDTTYYFNAGDTFYVTQEGSYHSGDENGAHSRMQVEYLGQLSGDDTPIMWHGDCSSHARSGGWNTYCANRTIRESLAGKVSVNTNGTFTVNEAGYYRVNAWAISTGGSGYAHVRLMVNDQTRYYGYQKPFGSWTDIFIDQTWPFNAGDTFYVTYHYPGNYAYHLGNGQGAHSQMQVHYAGPLAATESEPVPIMWSGYCSSHGTASDYNKYCTDSTDWDTLDDMLTINSDGTFTVNQEGYYRVNAWAASNGNSYAEARFVVNGQYKHHGKERVYNNNWSDNFIDVIWPLNAGDTFFVEYNNPGQYAYHSGNAEGTHSRMQIHFVGDF